MDIHLSEIEGGKSRFTFPSLPEEIVVKTSTNYQSYDIIKLGTVKIPSGTGVDTIAWTGEFFGASKKNEPIVHVWVAPSECKKIIQNWIDKGTILNLIVTETNINVDVTISNFEYREYGAYGNAEYNIVFSKNKELKIFTTTEMNITDYTKTEPRPAPSNSKTYTVVPGDNLWKIARQFYGGSGADWKKIYDANAAQIEEVAKKNGMPDSNTGWWIYAGEVFTIP